MLNIPDSILVMTALFNAGLAVFILRGNLKNYTNVFFGIFLSALSFWALALTGFHTTISHDFTLYSGKLSYAAALIIGASFYLFSVVFPGGVRPDRKTLFIVCCLSAIYISALLTGPVFLIRETVVNSWGNGVVLGVPEYIIFFLIFCFFFVGGLARIWQKYFNAQGISRIQLLAIGSSVSIAGAAGIYYNLILASPFVGDFRYLWTGPLFTSFIAITIMYSVFRLHLFNSKVIVTELLISLLWIFTLLRTLLASNLKEQIPNGGLFVLSLIIGSLLVRSVKTEVKTREKMEALAKDLARANEQLKILDKQKSEFVSIASHQLRSPLTAIKGYTSMLMEGSFGGITPKAKEAIKRTSQSSEHLVALVEDLLNVSRIESGKMTYDFEPVDLKKVIKDTIEALTPNIKENKLKITFNADDNERYVILADDEKIRQVALNLIDNSVKYTPSGYIKVHLSKIKGANKVLLTVKDSGVGVTPELKDRLFEKFSRGDEKTKLHVNGTGLGLYVAKEIIKAHRGNIWVESPGEGKGSTFFVELEAVSGK
ncbi:MAG: ATP-binding protein [Candidatus Paceibacterota bacterium]|jgi:signal transduction histidine kinase